MRQIYPAQKINLVERPEWAAYDTSGALQSTVMDAADESLRWIAQDKYYLADRAELILSIPPHGRMMRTKGTGVFKLPRHPKYLSDDEAGLLQAAYVAGDPRLEQFSNFMQTAAQFAWEEAVTPTIDDISAALADTISDLNKTGHYRMIKGAIYDVFIDPQWNLNGPQLMAVMFNDNTIFPEQKLGSYERFIHYNPASSSFVKVLLEKQRPIAKGVLEWQPPIERPDPDLVRDLISLFEEYKEELLPMFFRVLKNEMEGVDIGNRVDVSETARYLIETRSADVKSIRDELKRFFEQPKGASLGVNPFFMSPRTRRLLKDFEEMKELAQESSILEFEAFGDPPDRYLLTFHGLGLTSQGLRDTHKIEIDFGTEYPRQLPVIRWKTPILHPNIAGGTPCLGNLIMSPRVRLVDLVELLWDMNRMELLNPYGGYEKQVTAWGELRKEHDFPVDKRILRDKLPPREEPEEDDDVDLIILGR